MNDYEVTDYNGRSGAIMSLEGERKFMKINEVKEFLKNAIVADHECVQLCLELKIKKKLIRNM